MKELLKAIGMAKKSFPPIRKDAKNPHFKAAYATLGAILDAVEMPLIDQGVIIVHEQTLSPEGWLLQTSLIHWETEQTVFTVFPVSGSDPQKLGSALTYARRYNILNLLNLSTEDDDGNSASASKMPGSVADEIGMSASRIRRKALTELSTVSASQLKMLMDAASELGLSIENEKAIVEGFGFASRRHITTDKFDAVLSAYKMFNQEKHSE